MGGSYYDREVYTTTTTYSAQSEQILKKIDNFKPELNPYQHKLTCTHLNPIVCAIDVTGSMGDWTKVIFDKLPMFFGQIMMQGYLSDPSISFAAIGDSFSDQAPLQVTQFAQGAEIDDWISKLWLEGGGGANRYESYELAAYYYAEHCTMPNIKKATTKPFFFFTGDEGFYPAMKIEDASHIFGDQLRTGRTSEALFRALQNRFHVFLLHKRYSDAKHEERVLQQWQRVLGSEHVILLEDPKSVVDLMLGIIALVSKTRTLDEYVADMQSRGQTKNRVNNVKKELTELSEWVLQNKLSTSQVGEEDLVPYEEDAKLVEARKFFETYHLQPPNKTKNVKTTLSYGGAKLVYVASSKTEDFEKLPYEKETWGNVNSMIKNQLGINFLSSADVHAFLVKSGNSIYPLHVLDNEPESLGIKVELVGYSEKAAYYDTTPELVSHLLRAGDALKKREINRALGHYRKAKEIEPTNLYIWHSLISILCFQNNFEEALEELDDLLSSSPKYYRGLFRKAVILFTICSYREAITLFHQVALNASPYLRPLAAIYARKAVLQTFNEDGFLQFQSNNSIFCIPITVLRREILSRLDARSLGRISATCFLLWNAADSPSLWRNRSFLDFGKPGERVTNWKTHYLSNLQKKPNSLNYISVSSSFQYTCKHCGATFTSDNMNCSSSNKRKHEI